MLKGDCNICINGKMPSYSATCVECGLSRKNYKPMTNADRIRAMSDEELADYLYNHDFCKEPFKSKWQNCCNGDCQKCVSDWLKSPVEVKG